MATHRVVTRLGPNLTLADVAKEAGVSAATLVQRFGSKRGLLLAFASLAVEGTDEEYAAIRHKYPDPLDAIREVVRCFAQMAPSPEAVSNALAFLQMDLSDPEFHAYAQAAARHTLIELKKILDDGVRSGAVGEVRHGAAGVCTQRDDRRRDGVMGRHARGNRRRDDAGGCGHAHAPLPRAPSNEARPAHDHDSPEDAPHKFDRQPLAPSHKTRRPEENILRRVAVADWVRWLSLKLV